MKWQKQSDYLAVSSTQPPYKVARFIVAGQAIYRASIRGEFIGEMTGDPKEAQAICERHHEIMGEAA